MPEIICTTVYRLHELSNSAKEKARAWYRDGGFDDDWHDAVYADFESICDILGVTLRMRPVPLFGGGSRGKPCIYFSGFWSQGDGACFEGCYAYTPQASVKIREYAPKDAELHRIVDALQAIQRRNFYGLNADIRHRGRHYHEYCMSITVNRNSATGQDMTRDAEEVVVEALRDLARWLYRALEGEYIDRTSDTAVDETIAANEYTFTQAGRRFG